MNDPTACPVCFDTNYTRNPENRWKLELCPECNPATSPYPVENGETNEARSTSG